jgi:hypothetical protein
LAIEFLDFCLVKLSLADNLLAERLGTNKQIGQRRLVFFYAWKGVKAGTDDMVGYMEGRGDIIWFLTILLLKLLCSIDDTLFIVIHGIFFGRFKNLLLSFSGVKHEGFICFNWTK